ncbi:MAG: hypothetical protein IJ274_04850, partial [Lachnospiraceae bacterium]|nr:hypothetical protein [Lachnospiraceae bacterium]
YLSTDYREAGWLGNAGWPMGLRTQLMVVLSYFLVSRFLVGNKYFFEIVIKVSGVVFALGILNHFDIWPLEMTHKNPSFLSTIGNTNWFCGYWSVVAWIAVVRYWNRDYHSTKKEKWDTVFDLFMATVAMFTGIIQGSDSGMLTMAVIFVVLFWISLDNGDRMQRLLEVLFMLLAACCVGTVINGIFVKENIYPNALIDLMTRTICPWIGALIVGLLLFYVKKKNQMNCFRIVKAGLLKKIILTIGAIILVGYFLILVFNTMLPGRLPYFADKSAFIFNNEWGAQRGCTWKAAFLTWWNQDLWHKLIGVGPDGMWSFIVSGKVPELKAMVLEVFVGNRLLNGHGEWITNLANLGILGAVSYAGLMVTYIVRCMKKGSSMPLLYIFAITVLSYTVNNIFSFQTIVNLTHVFVMMGVGESLLRSEKSISN